MKMRLPLDDSFSIIENMMSQTMLSQQHQQQQHNHHHQRQDQNNEIDDFLNILMDENTNNNNNNNNNVKNIQHPHRNPLQQNNFNSISQSQPSQQNTFNSISQSQPLQLHIPQIQPSASIPIPARNPQHAIVPEVKIKCEDGNLSDYPHSDGGFNDDVSPFQSGVSSPGSSCSAMSGPGSPVMMDSNNSHSSYSQNYLTPESAFYMQPGSPTHSGNQSGDSAGSAYKYDPRPLGRKKRRNLVPDDKKNNEYWEKRKRNNIAARRSREERRTKELQTFESMKHLQQENNALKQTIKMLMESQNELQKENYSLRHCLELSQAMYNKPMQQGGHQL